MLIVVVVVVDRFDLDGFYIFKEVVGSSTSRVYEL